MILAEGAGSSKNPWQGCPRSAERAARKEKATAASGAAEKGDWPKGRAAQAKAVLVLNRYVDGSPTAGELAQRFSHAPRETIDALLQASSP